MVEFHRIQYAVRLREINRNLGKLLYSEHSVANDIKETEICFDEMSSFDSNESSIDGLDEKETELEELDNFYKHKRSLLRLKPDYILLPDMSNYKLDDVPKFLLDAYDSVGEGDVTTDALKQCKKQCKDAEDAENQEYKM